MVPMAPGIKTVVLQPGQKTATGWEPDGMFTAGSDTAAGTVYVEAGQHLTPFEKAHEMGHMLADRVLTAGDRHYFQRQMGLGDRQPWDTGTGSTGYSSPSEWFADYYAAAATKMDLKKEGVSSYATIGPKRLAAIEAALGRIGKRYNLQPYKP